jgi:aerotolerance regulator-like protein/VWA domain-containing protein
VSFLNPVFLFGLLAAAIPIVIHLFTRKRPREVRFPSLDFLSEVNQSEIRRLRLRQWLLLLLRTLAVAAIALAMSRPALEGSVGARSGAATTVVALLDVSGSMGAGTRGGTLLADGRRAVEDLLATLGPADELLLVPYDEQPHPISARPISDLGRLRAALQALQSGARTTDHARALELAGRTLAASRALNRELFWISDFQAGGFARADDADAAAAPVTLPAGPWDRARTYLMPLAPASHANVALTEATLAPADAGTALAVGALAFEARAGDLAVEVRDAAGAELGRGFLPVAERGEASALLPLARLPELGGAASIPDDALALDNRRVFAAGRSGSLRVLLREGGGPSPLRIALEAGSPASGLVVEAVGAGGLAERIGRADVVVLHDVERLAAPDLQAVLDYWRAGGALLITLGTRADPAFWNASVLQPLGTGRLGPIEQPPPGASWRLQRAIAGHPVLAGFPSRPGEALSSAQFRSIPRFAPQSGARVLLQFDREHPALLELPHTMVFAAALGPEASDFPVSGAFLPLLHQIVKVLGRGTAAAALVPGERYAAPAATGTWRIEDERGREVPSELTTSAGTTRIVSAPLDAPGLYRVLQGGELRTTFAVNPDARESDLTAVAEAALVRAFPGGRARLVRPGADLARRVREARYGRELWTWFVLLAVLLLVAESVIARLGMETRAPATPAR